MRGPGWGVPEDVLRQLPGPAFEVVQAAEESGLPVERPAPPRPPPTGVLRYSRPCVAWLAIGWRLGGYQSRHHNSAAWEVMCECT